MQPPPPQKHSWINLAEMKDQLTKKLGPEKSNQYFDFLKGFLSLKLSKVEFDKLCLRTVGRDNIPLHNQLIRSLLKNACTRKVLPPPPLPPLLDDHSRTTILQSKHKIRTWLHAPLGIQYGARKVSSLARISKSVTIFDNGGLIETIKLKERMDQHAATQGLQGVSMECASLLNNGLDAYLKGLIRSFTHEPMNNSLMIKNQAHFRPNNGVKVKRLISLIDFTVAMELNPRQLGEDWPLLLEKICTHVFEE